MKARFLICSFLVACSTMAAAQSMLKVRLADNSVINIAVDDRYFNKKGTSVTMGDLPPGRHRITIYTVVQTRNGRGHEQVVYSGKIETHNGNVTLFTYDADNQQTDIQEQDMNSFTQNNPPPNGPGNYNNAPQPGNNYSDNYNNNRGQQFNQPSRQLVSPTLTDVKIDQLKTRVMDKKTDTERMKLMKDALSSEKMTTDQVSAMMDWYNFEDSKVEFAKWTYPNTVDKENFPSLENKLTYKDYVDDLDKFIKENSK